MTSAALTTRTGGLHDSVHLQIGSEFIFIAESWQIVQSVLSTPARFTIELGQSNPVAAWFTSPVLPTGSGTGAGPVPSNSPRFPIGSPFLLYVGGALQMSGIYEGFHVHGNATRITLKGRDSLSLLMRSHPEAQRSFLNGTYTQLVEYALAAAFIPFTLNASNAGSRQIQAGVPISVIAEPTTIDEINAQGTASLGQQTSGTLVGGVTAQTHENRIHENLLAFTRRHLDRAGLVLMAGPKQNSFILSQPNGNQKPIYQIIRRRGAGVAQSNVIDCSFSNDVTHRHGKYSVYGRGGGGAAGRTTSLGTYVDPEMVALGDATGAGFGDQGILYRDVNVSSRQQAIFMALRKAAEERRDGWNLTYTVSGHRLQTIADPSQWAVVTPDTCVQVTDDELGLDDVYYIETVTRSRMPQTQTEVRLMRRQDLIFGSSVGSGDE